MRDYTEHFSGTKYDITWACKVMGLNPQYTPEKLSFHANIRIKHMVKVCLRHSLAVQVINSFAAQ